MVLTIHISEHVEVESSDEQRRDDKGAVKFRGQDSADAQYDYDYAACKEEITPTILFTFDCPNQDPTPLTPSRSCRWLHSGPDYQNTSPSGMESLKET